MSSPTLSSLGQALACTSLLNATFHTVVEEHFQSLRGLFSWEQWWDQTIIHVEHTE